MNHNQKNSIIVNNTLGLPKVNGSYEEFERNPRRTLVLSSGDVDRMAVASSRARLMMDLVKNPDESSREFGSYYRGRKSDNNSGHFMTSHTASIPIPKRVIPTYPSLVQNISWDPSVADYPQRELGEEEKFHCRCNKCQMKRCPGASEYPEENKGNRGDKGGEIFENSLTQDNSRAFAFRDNITRFTDNSTMTSQFADAYCEVYPSLKRNPRTSEVYISTSDMDITEKVQQQTSSTYPTPILKKKECDTCCYQTYSNKGRVKDVYDEAARDTNGENDYKKLLNSIPKRELMGSNFCPSNRDNFKDSDSGRKNLYNEGISDSIAETTIPHYLRCPLRMQPQIKCPVRKDFSRFHSPIRPSTKRDYSPVTNKCVGEREPWIPFGHREHSKYHYDCKEPVKKVDFRYDDACARHGLVVSSRQPKQSQARVSPCDRLSGKLPKKLLTSVRDIDLFVGNKRTNMRI